MQLHNQPNLHDLTDAGLVPFQQLRLKYPVQQLIYHTLLDMQQNDCAAKASIKQLADACDALVENSNESKETQAHREYKYDDRWQCD